MDTKKFVNSRWQQENFAISWQGITSTHANKQAFPYGVEKIMTIWFNPVHHMVVHPVVWNVVVLDLIIHNVQFFKEKVNFKTQTNSRISFF